MTVLTKSGKRFDNILNFILKNHPQDKWVLSIIIPIFLEATKSTTTLLEEHLMIDKLNKLIDSYEFRYNQVFEKLKTTIKEEIRKALREGSEEKLYKIEGLLVSDNNKKTQSQLLSDIRAITGVTTVDAKEYTPRLPKEGRSYDRLTVKVDPYPYLKNGKFDIETIQLIIDNINRIKGVVKFKVDNPQMINIGI
jgi:hypothetical protein